MNTGRSNSNSTPSSVLAHIGVQRRLSAVSFAFLVLAMFLLTPPQAGNAQEPAPTPSASEDVPETETAVPEEEAGAEALSSGDTARLLVTISPRARIGAVMERAGRFGNAFEHEELSKVGVFVMEVPAENLEDRMKQIRNISGVRYIEPELWAYATETIPDDPGFVNQYGLLAIRAPQGWDYSTGSDSITIAIIDSGVDYGHVDLAGKITAGYDFVNNDALPQDDFGHGTHVAGIAAASTNNGAGIAGVSWGARIMPVKVLNASGGGTFENVAAGIIWAVDHGAQVINLSLGGGAYSAALENAVLYAYNRNVLMTASSGNTGGNFVLYPARFPQVIAVGASNMTNQPASFSNYGPEVDLAAPGENIYSLWIGGYQIRTGTSMSAPHVSGLAAILLGYISGADAARGVIEATALDIGPAGWDDFSGAGLIQMDAALALVAPSPILENGSDRPPAPFPFPAIIPALTGTSTPLPSLKPATPTHTVSPPGAASPTPTQTPTATPASEDISVWANKAERLKVFLSPYFCGAVLLILPGVWLLWRAAKKGGFTAKRQRKRRLM